MAILIPMPDGVEISSMNFGLAFPGQVVHTSPFTGTSQFINRSTGIWTGTAQLTADRETASDTTYLEVEAFLAALAGQANYTELPLNRPHVPIQTADKRHSIVFVETADDGRTSVCIAAHDQLRPETALLGAYFTLPSGRVHQVIKDAPLDYINTVIFSPDAVGSTTAFSADGLFTQATKIRARRISSDALVSPRTPDRWGPWTLDWIEAIIPPSQ